MYKTYVFPIHPDDQEQARQLSRCAGRIYSKTVSTVRKLHKRKDIRVYRSGQYEAAHNILNQVPEKKREYNEQYHNLRGFLALIFYAQQCCLSA